MKTKLVFILGLIGFLITGICIGLFIIKSTNQEGNSDSGVYIDIESRKKEYLHGSSDFGDAAELEQRAEKRHVFEQYAIGFNEPVALGFWKYDYFVSSRLDKAIYQIKDEQKIPLAPADYITDMVLDDDGSVISPIFFENRLIHISPKGIVKPITTLLDGPAGIAWSPGGCYFVSNYLKGTISCVESGGKTTDVISGLSGPVGLLIHNKILYITDYLSRDASVVSIPIIKIGSENVSVKGRELTHATGVGFIDEVMYVIHSEDGVGVVSRVDLNGNKTLIAVSGLPEPVFGKFSPDRYVYMVSPNDPDGKIMRMRFDI